MAERPLGGIAVPRFGKFFARETAARRRLHPQRDCDRQDSRRHHSDPAARPTRLFRKFWRARRRHQAADDRGYHLSSVFDVEADHQRRRDDAGRGGQALARRSRFKVLPAFADVKVGVEKRDEHEKPSLVLEPVNRPITIEDLLRHTSGLTYGFYGDGAVRKLYAQADLFNGDIDNAEFAERLAALPLAEQPGTLWDYGHSTDVLGRVIEVVSGQQLFQFEKQRLLDPLGMTETAFYVADAAKRPRIAEPMPDDRFISPVAGIRDPMSPRRWESGGAGMVGTIGDYARFAQMLLNRGAFDGRRYLKSETIALMTSDHIGPKTKIARDYFYFPGAASGFGLGFAVRTTQPPNTSWPTGEYRWDGIAGTFFFIDPKDDMFVIFMVQTPSQRGRIQLALKTLIYEAFGK